MKIVRVLNAALMLIALPHGASWGAAAPLRLEQYENLPQEHELYNIRITAKTNGLNLLAQRKCFVNRNDVRLMCATLDQTAATANDKLYPKVQVDAGNFFVNQCTANHQPRFVAACTTNLEGKREIPVEQEPPLPDISQEDFDKIERELQFVGGDGSTPKDTAFHILYPINYYSITDEGVASQVKESQNYFTGVNGLLLTEENDIAKKITDTWYYLAHKLVPGFKKNIAKLEEELRDWESQLPGADPDTAKDLKNKIEELSTEWRLHRMPYNFCLLNQTQRGNLANNMAKLFLAFIAKSNNQPVDLDTVVKLQTENKDNLDRANVKMPESLQVFVNTADLVVIPNYAAIPFPSAFEIRLRKDDKALETILRSHLIYNHGPDQIAQTIIETIYSVHTSDGYKLNEVLADTEDKAPILKQSDRLLMGGVGVEAKTVRDNNNGVANAITRILIENGCYQWPAKMTTATKVDKHGKQILEVIPLDKQKRINELAKDNDWWRQILINRGIITP